MTVEIAVTKSPGTRLDSVIGGAIVLTMGALLAFVVEMLLAANGVRLMVDRSAAAEPGGKA